MLFLVAVFICMSHYKIKSKTTEEIFINLPFFSYRKKKETEESGVKKKPNKFISFFIGFLSRVTLWALSKPIIYWIALGNLSL